MTIACLYEINSFLSPREFTDLRFCPDLDDPNGMREKHKYKKISQKWKTDGTFFMFCRATNIKNVKQLGFDKNKHSTLEQVVVKTFACRSTQNC